MNTKVVVASIVILVLLFFGGIFLVSSQSNRPYNLTEKTTLPPPELKREIVQFPINPNSAPDINANTLPTFTFDLTEQKFRQILDSTGKKMLELVAVNIVRKVDASTDLSAHIEVDKGSKKLLVRPEEVANFKPGLYKISLSLRTVEGVVDIEQDFSWGVIAVNTNKSIYTPGETAKIGYGVLNDKGETQCMTGFAHVTTLTAIITSPTGEKTSFSVKDNSIKDSGKCGPITFTNEADFQSLYKTAAEGIYQIEVEANVKGVKRKITDYFKVVAQVPFDIERLSYPMRIYPHSVYPATFKVTARKDYSGQVSDLVPSSFHLEQISDGGTVKDEGYFKRITWSVSFKAGESRLFTYFIHFPKVSPEFYLVGPIKIGDFAEARNWQIASDAINSTSGLVTYEDNGGSNTYYNVWTGTAFNSRLSMSATPADSRWFREVSSPKTGEKIVALIDNVGTTDPIMVLTWSGTAWTLDKNIPINSGSADVTRPFDIAYEELSGDALIVFSDYSTNQLRYLKRVNGAWDSGTTVGTSGTAGTAYGTFKRWVRLEPQFESDSILVGYLNDSEQVGAMIWDGATNSFGNQFDETASTVTATSAEQAFDIAWETSSGTPMIFWGTTGNLLTMREFTSGSWQAETTVASGFAQDIAWVFASADPVSTSNNISLSLQQAVACVIRMGVWTGSTATMNAVTVPSCPSVSTNNLADTAFENNSGKAMFVYVPDSATDDDIAWLTWTSGGGFSLPTTESMNPDIIEGVQLYSDLNTTSMMLLFHDNAATCDLYGIQWDGTSWSAMGTAIYDNMCASADNSTEPYGFGFDRNLETQVAYRWFANSVDLGGSLSVLTAQDTPYTLSTANQAFRLRLLLYYPDSLLTATARQYKLQYVDPGTGSCASPAGGTPSTWTDVPTSGGSTISFNNNLTLDDGNNIATSAADPSYQGKVVEYQDYEEFNNFTNSRTNMLGDRTAIWDFSLIDNTSYDRVAQTYCFRVSRSNDLVLRIGLYPQISTAAVDDVLIQGGTNINQGTAVNNL